MIDDATPAQARTLFTRFYGGGEDASGLALSNEEVNKLGRDLEVIVESELKEGRRVSMAALQGLFIRNGARDAVGECRVLFGAGRT